MNWSLKSLPVPWKLKMVILSTVGAALLVTAIALFTYERISFNQRLEQRLATLAEVIGDNSVTSLAFEQLDTAREILAALEAEQQIVAACIYGRDGRIVERYIRPGASPVLPERPLQEGFHWSDDRLEFVSSLVDRKTDEWVGNLYFMADFQGMQQRLRLYAGVVAVVLLGSLILAYALSSRLQRVISVPILDLAKAAKVISQDRDYSVRAQKRSEDELGMFVDAFNQMIAQIQQQDQALRQAKDQLEVRVAERTRELLDLQLQHELILNSAGEGIYGLDLQGRMSFVNPAAAKTIGWSIKEVVGAQEHAVLKHSDPAGLPYRAEDCPVCADFRLGKAYSSNDQVLWRKDGTSFHAEYVRTPILLDGELAGAVVLFKDISEQKQAEQKLAVLNKRLQETSRQAGMAEVATGVLHNVGNVLNSVNVSANLMADYLRQFRPSSLVKVASVLREHATSQTEFFSSDSQGKELPNYLVALAQHITQTKEAMAKELDLLVKNIDHIKHIVSRQQSLAAISGVIESVPVTSLVEDALQLHPGILTRLGIRVVREYDETPLIAVDKQKVLQILVNLVRNAREALRTSSAPEKKLTLRIALQGDQRVRIEVQDNGVGIPADHLTRIFSHGFTTKTDGHGFGLHSAAIAAREVGGSLSVHSEGLGQGATFALELPLGKS